MRPNYFISAINHVLIFVSASICAVILLLISFIYIYQRSLALRTQILTIPFDDVAFLLGASSAYLILLVPIVYCGAAFGRFALRVAPPRLTGRVRLGAFVLTILPLLVFALYEIIFLVYVFNSSKPLHNQPLSIDAAAFGVLSLLWFAVFSFLVIKRHLRPLSFLDRPYVLFLRRFSRFSDRTVINLVLRQTPARKPVVFLVPPRSRAGDWNPFLVGFAGMKLLHPLRSVPLVVTSRNTEWEESIQKLIQRAQFVIVDISERSSAIETELEMINQAGCWHKTILLEEVSKTRMHFEPEGHQIIHYRKSWIRGIPRMILGYLAMHVSIIPLVIIIIQSINNFWARIASLPLGILFLGWLYVSFFMHPSIDSKNLTQEAPSCRQQVTCIFPAN